MVKVFPARARRKGQKRAPNLQISLRPATCLAAGSVTEWLVTRGEASDCGDQPALNAGRLSGAVRAALRGLPCRFERLVCIASLQNPDTRSQFCHLLPLVRDWENVDVDLALCREHHEILEEWLGLALEDKLTDLESYAALRDVAMADIARQWLLPERRDCLIPRGALPPERRLFQGDTELLLTILVSKNVIPAW